VAHFGITTPDSPVLQIIGSRIRFRPLLVRPGEHITAQASCFCTLIRYWEATPDAIELLVVDLTDASKTRIRDCMQDVSVSDVVRGIQLWETLPCRIQKVMVYAPSNMPGLIWAMRASMRMCLPTKIQSKVHFSRQSNGDPTEEWEADANDDAFLRAVDKPEDADASGAQEFIKGLIETKVVPDQACDATLCEAEATHGNERTVVLT
jgi:hypothetical protein